MSKTLDTIEDYFYNATDPRMDGFTQWEYKKKLYEIKWKVDRLLPKISTFVGEEEFLKENRSKYESQ